MNYITCSNYISLTVAILTILGIKDKLSVLKSASPNSRAHQQGIRNIIRKECSLALPVPVFLGHCAGLSRRYMEPFKTARRTSPKPLCTRGLILGLQKVSQPHSILAPQIVTKSMPFQPWSTLVASFFFISGGIWDPCFEG